MIERRPVIFADDVCHSTMTKLRILFIALVAFALLAIPAGASAKGRDSDRDGMPNKWEHKFRLKVHRNDARRDADKDGLTNRAEFRDHTNPRKADTDNDGLKDGDEVETDHNPRDRDSDDDGIKDGRETTGTVKSFDNGLLVIELPDKSTVSGQVTGATEVKCEDDEHGADDSRTTATAADHGGDDGGGDDRGDDNRGPGGGDDDEHGDDDDQGTQPATCQIAVGAVVHEAELELVNGTATWEEVELVQ